MSPMLQRYCWANPYQTFEFLVIVAVVVVVKYYCIVQKLNLDAPFRWSRNWTVLKTLSLDHYGKEWSLWTRCLTRTSRTLFIIFALATKTELDMFTMFSRTGVLQKGLRWPKNVEQLHDIFWPRGGFCTPYCEIYDISLLTHLFPKQKIYAGPMHMFPNRVYLSLNPLLIRKWSWWWLWWRWC